MGEAAGAPCSSDQVPSACSSSLSSVSYEVDVRSCPSEKAAAIKSRLDARWAAKMKAREAAKKDRDATKKSNAVSSENVDAFREKFDRCKEMIETKVAALEDAIEKGSGSETRALAEKGTRTYCLGELDKLVGDAEELRKMLAEATVYLPSYDIRATTSALADVEGTLAAARSRLAPRKKFSFGARRKQRKAKAKAAVKTADQAKVEKSSALALEKLTVAVEHSVEGRTDQTVWLVSANGCRPSESLPGEFVETFERGQDLRLGNLIRCNVRICAPVGALRLIGLKECTVYAGPVHGSCFVEKCSSCTFAIASRQMRIHDTEDVDFYLRVLSGPIIEHCARVRFAPYAVTYPFLDAELKEAGMPAEEPDPVAGIWSQVNDFRWLKTERSPNWSLVPNDERLEGAKFAIPIVGIIR